MADTATIQNTNPIVAPDVNGGGGGPAATFVAGQTVNTPSPAPISSISSSILTPANPTPYVTPNPVPIPDVSTLGGSNYDSESDTLEETPAEENESSLTKTLQDLNTSLVGESAYQTQANTNAGVDKLTDQQSDLSSQLDQLKNEAAAIPNQLQLSATGRGITAGGLAPIQTSALRNNSIQALTISSMLDSTNGLLASAQRKADAAVAAKYGPIQEEINAATANLKLIQNDPATSLQDKNRANQQLAAQNAKQVQLDKDKQNSTDVLTAMQAAAKNGADASTLSKMQAAPNGAAALQIAASAGFGNSNISDLITSYPDAGIQPGDSLQTAQQKILTSPSYTTAQKTKVLQNQELQSEINKNNAAAGAGGSGTGQAIGTTGSPTVDATSAGYTTTLVPGAGGLTQSAIDQAALSYSLTGILPSGSRSTTGAGLAQASAIKNRAAEMNANGNIQANKATLTSNSAALKTQTDYLNTVQRAFNTANDTLDSLTTWMTANGINSNQFPDYNSFINYLKGKGIDPGAAGGYNAQISTLRSEYAQVLSRGGAVTDQTRSEALQLIPDGLSPAQLQKVADRIKVDGNNVVNDAQSQVQSIQDKINGIVTSGGVSGSDPQLPDQISTALKTNSPGDVITYLLDNGDDSTKQFILQAQKDSAGYSPDAILNFLQTQNQ